ncbi:hypothetical protein Ahy_A06g026255 isoform A [Arachis hypogaea]|uniref:Methyltransferase type 11 domain-containing protein n=1 Tax=Arachis hypogaea TaxID=3818 RepID=A0A445CJY5_ARAHY|nr:hypothetical protein Ahy_A06g026255 isoform A [Arachis hypogaea]
MGSVSLKIGDGTARFKKATLCSSAVNIVMIFSVITTNLFALYAFTSSPKHTQILHNNKNISIISEQVSIILREINLSQKKLAQMEKELLGYESIDLSRPNIANELKMFLQHHQLPLGKDSRTGITEMVPSVGHLCEKNSDLLSQYMSYKINAPCNDDWSVAQKLIVKGCEPLPRRRCFSKTVSKVGLNPFPNSLWNPFVVGSSGNKSVNWSGLNCKSFECLKGNGGVRIGFDIGGGSGTFAARMAERNVTVITSTLNVDAPFSEFIAARGLFPLYLSLDHRFPFYDNVFDLIHASSAIDVVGVGGKIEKLEFLMFDIDRVLRAGGLLWIDNFYCANEEKKQALTRLIEKFGYKKLKWVVGEKVDSSGSGKSEVVLSAVLQKPVRA